MPEFRSFDSLAGEDDEAKYLHTAESFENIDGSETTKRHFQGSKRQYFRSLPLKEWLPELYLEGEETDLQSFFYMLSIIKVSCGSFNAQVRAFCYHLWTYYHKDKAGVLHKKLLLSEIKTKLM
ncbi:hypothetical protein BGZ83_006968 [Gryganskiella cystojenkinii]|nr:hypothetical protein BGZ83_006968 [Gryganskiella cystojenkinii]